MPARAEGSGLESFPSVRPRVVIEPLDKPAPELCWREVRNFFSALEIGDRTMWATYDQPDWRITSVSYQVVAGRVRVHGIEGLEVLGAEYIEEAAWAPEERRFFLAVSGDWARWLGTLSGPPGQRVLRTLRDEGFDQDWGSFVTRLRDTRRFERGPDGSIAQRHGPDHPGDNAGILGMVKVTVGEREFECVHVLEVPPCPSEEDLLVESFVSAQRGRLILCRRYNGRLASFGNRRPWDEELPTATRLVVDGVTFVHWYDCLGHVALGLDPADYEFLAA